MWGREQGLTKGIELELRALFYVKRFSQTVGTKEGERK